jgi:hypothetical protein
MSTASPKARPSRIVLIVRSKAEPFDFSKVIHEHSGLSLGQCDWIPGRRCLCRRSVKPDVDQVFQASCIVDRYLLSAFNYGLHFLLADQVGAAAVKP